MLNVASVACTVDTEEGEYNCAARGRLTESDTGEKNPVTVGDHVRIEVTGNMEGVVTEVLPRNSRLSRTSPNDLHTEHVIVANLDQVLIVASVKDPPLTVGIIDRYVIAAMYGGMEPAICINKVDLAEEDSDHEEIVRIYRELGYPVVVTSATTGQGLDDLRSVLKDQSTVLAGHSGVGKSSLINALQPGLELKTAPLGWKGTHCTSAVTLLKLDIGGYVADTPGVRELNPWNIEKHEVQQFFPEIWELSHDCRMPDCTHVHEPDCEVQDALERGEINPRRYESYMGIVSTIESQTRPRQTDVEEPDEQVSQERREPSRRTQKQRIDEMVEEELTKYYERRDLES
ncbi:MAG: ribosome small subunit-dependent GTPase A [Planctomycetota bacterium]